jgi:oxygen-independent coproporphyrinogen-3 oxidase
MKLVAMAAAPRRRTPRWSTRARARSRPGAARRVRALPFCSCAARIATSRSTRGRPRVPHDGYADAVIAELGARRAWFDGAGPLASIYFGGGTPGLWRPDAVRARDRGRAFRLGSPRAEALEITVEANPGEVDEARLAGCGRLA